MNNIIRRRNLMISMIHNVRVIFHSIEQFRLLLRVHVKCRFVIEYWNSAGAQERISLRVEYSVDYKYMEHRRGESGLKKRYLRHDFTEWVKLSLLIARRLADRSGVIFFSFNRKTTE